MKIKRASLTIGSIITSLFISACDDSDDNNNGAQNNFVTPPANPSVATSTSNDSNTNGVNVNVANQDLYETEIFNKINSERNSRGLPALTRSSEIDALAGAHNIYMRQQAPANSNPIVISHDNARARANTVFSMGFSSFGENVAGIRGYAVNQVSDRFVINWINSPGHFKNITGNFTQTGIDVLVAPDNTIYATQIFAK